MPAHDEAQAQRADGYVSFTAASEPAFKAVAAIQTKWGAQFNERLERLERAKTVDEFLIWCEGFGLHGFPAIALFDYLYGEGMFLAVRQALLNQPWKLKYLTTCNHFKIGEIR